MNTPPSTQTFPRGFPNILWFAVFNALSFQIILNSPMVLYAKSLGASATALGILTGMMPLLVIFQIPAAAYIPRVGYKRFVLGGWSIRVMFIAAMAAVPILLFLNPAARLALVLFLSFGFNMSRGISSCAWLPWITSIIPANLRGRYLAADQAVVNAASSLTFLGTGYALGNNPAAWQFTAIFAFSALAGAISLKFLRQIPEAPVADDPAAASKEGVPWLEISRFAPFRKLLRVNVAWSFAYGGFVAFSTAYLRGMGNLPEGTILTIAAIFFVGGLVSLLVGRHLDDLGSKPAITFACMLWLVIVAGWTLMAAGVLPLNLTMISALQFLMGVGAATFNMANVRLAMVISPPMGKTHFFALFSVVANLSLGLAPVLWGLFIDAFATTRTPLQGFEVNRFSLFFIGAGVLFAVTLGLSRKLDEPAAARVEVLIRELLVTSPQRFWARMFSRL